MKQNRTERRDDMVWNRLERRDPIAQRLQELEALEQAGRLVVISPSVDLQVTRLEGDMEKLGRLYWMGNQDANAQLERLRAYLV